MCNHNTPRFYSPLSSPRPLANNSSKIKMGRSKNLIVDALDQHCESINIEEAEFAYVNPITLYFTTIILVVIVTCVPTFCFAVQWIQSCCCPSTRRLGRLAGEADQVRTTDSPPFHEIQTALTQEGDLPPIGNPADDESQSCCCSCAAKTAAAVRTLRALRKKRAGRRTRDGRWWRSEEPRCSSTTTAAVPRPKSMTATPPQSAAHRLEPRPSGYAASTRSLRPASPPLTRTPASPVRCTSNRSSPPPTVSWLQELVRRITENVHKEAVRIVNETLNETLNTSLGGGAPAEAVDDENATTGGGPRGTSIDAAFKENAPANVQAGTTPAEEAKGDEKGVEVDAMAGAQQVKTLRPSVLVQTRAPCLRSRLCHRSSSHPPATTASTPHRSFAFSLVPFPRVRRPSRKSWARGASWCLFLRVCMQASRRPRRKLITAQRRHGLSVGEAHQLQRRRDVPHQVQGDGLGTYEAETSPDSEEETGRESLRRSLRTTITEAAKKKALDEERKEQEAEKAEAEGARRE